MKLAIATLILSVAGYEWPMLFQTDCEVHRLTIVSHPEPSQGKTANARPTTGLARSITKQQDPAVVLSADHHVALLPTSQDLTTRYALINRPGILIVYIYT